MGSPDHLATVPHWPLVPYRRKGSERRGYCPSDRQRPQSKRIRPHDQLRQGNGRRNEAAKQPNLPAYSSQSLLRSGDSLRSCSRCPFGNGKSTTSRYRCPRLGDGIPVSQTDGPSFVKSCEIRNGWRKCRSLQQKRRCRKFFCSNALEVPEEGLEPSQPLRLLDFESSASAIPPLRRIIASNAVFAFFAHRCREK